MPLVLLLVSRYNVQHNLTGNPNSAPFPDAIMSRLSPETIELASYAPCDQLFPTAAYISHVATSRMPGTQS